MGKMIFILIFFEFSLIFLKWFLFNKIFFISSEYACARDSATLEKIEIFQENEYWLRWAVL